MGIYRILGGTLWKGYAVSASISAQSRVRLLFVCIRMARVGEVSVDKGDATIVVWRVNNRCDTEDQPTSRRSQDLYV